MPTTADVPTSSPVSSWPKSLTRRSSCTSPMISDRCVYGETTYPLHFPRRLWNGARTHTSTRDKSERERGKERRRQREIERGRGRRTRTATATTTTAAAAAWWSSKGGCTGCFDDHRVMSPNAWRPAVAADDDPEAAFPAVRPLPIVPLLLLPASSLRPNSPGEFSSSCVARARPFRVRAPRFTSFVPAPFPREPNFRRRHCLLSLDFHSLSGIFCARWG